MLTYHKMPERIRRSASHLAIARIRELAVGGHAARKAWLLETVGAWSQGLEAWLQAVMAKRLRSDVRKVD